MVSRLQTATIYFFCDARRSLKLRCHLIIAFAMRPASQIFPWIKLPLYMHQKVKNFGSYCDHRCSKNPEGSII